MHKITIVAYVQSETDATNLADLLSTRASEDDIPVYVLSPVVEQVSPVLDDNAQTALCFFKGEPF